MDNVDNGWDKDQKFVLNEIERLREDISSVVGSDVRAHEMIQNTLLSIQVELATLKTSLKFHGGLWGAIASVVTIVGVILLKKVSF